MAARYRLANQGWEMAIAPGGDPIPNGFEVEISNNPLELNNVQFEFELLYTPVSGYTWTLRGPSGQFNRAYSTRWRPSDGCFPTCADDPVYGIQLRASANGNPNEDSSMLVTEVSFTGQGVTVCGSLPPAGLSATVGAGNTPKTQWILSDSDLSKVSWAVRGKVKGVRQTGSRQEDVTFNIYTVPQSALGDSDVACEGQDCTRCRPLGAKRRALLHPVPQT